MPFYGYGSAGFNFVAAAEASETKGHARKAGRRTDELDAKLDRALMACEAMWSILRDKLGVTDEELLNRINELDLSDGRLDGKVRKTCVSCPTCGRTIGRRFTRCMYCGQQILHDPFG